MNISNLFIFSFALFIFSSCDSAQEFDAKKWKEKGVDWWMTDVREKMVEDLTKSDTLIGMNQMQVVELLGLPESENEGEFRYLIREKYGTNIDPVYISNLIIEFDDLQVRNCRVEK